MQPPVGYPPDHQPTNAPPAQSAGSLPVNRESQVMIGLPIRELTVGQVAELSRQVTQKIVNDFGETVGDFNPLHFDAAFAHRISFKSPIVHGAFSAGLISAAVGTLLPGPGTLYMTQDLRFLKPVFIGDTIVARVEVVELITDRNRARLKTTCLNQHGDEVLTGEAWVKPPKERIVYEPKTSG